MKVAGLTLHTYGGMIGQQMRMGESDEGHFGTNAFNYVIDNIGGTNWQVIVCQVCHAGDELELRVAVEY